MYFEFHLMENTMFKSVLFILLMLVPVFALADSTNKSGENAHERGKEQFEKADKDHDGTLTKEEAKAMPHVYKNFDAIDVDKDGTVTLEEIHNYMKAKREQKKPTDSKSN
jgi:Ca2+-binding EF-hand superfamily protein